MEIAALLPVRNLLGRPHSKIIMTIKITGFLKKNHPLLQNYSYGIRRTLMIPLLKETFPLGSLAPRENTGVGRRLSLLSLIPRGVRDANLSQTQKGDSEEIELNRRYFIIGERRISSYWWATAFLVGGLGFLITGISSYIKYNLFTGVYRIFESLGLLSIAQETQTSGVLESVGSQTQTLLESGVGAPLMEVTGGESLVFFPQGLLMCFYGSLGLLLSLYWWLLIYWNVGGGFNEFNKKEGFMRIFRWGYPGKNRRIDIVYSLKDIEAVRVELKQSQGFLQNEQTIFIKLLSTPVTSGPLGAENIKEKREIPLGGVGDPLTLKEIEKQASDLANFLQVSLEGL